MPVFPSGAGLKNRASGETQGPKTVRRARLVCGRRNAETALRQTRTRLARRTGFGRHAARSGLGSNRVRFRPQQNRRKERHVREKPATFEETGWHSRAASEDSERRPRCQNQTRAMNRGKSLPSPADTEPIPMRPPFRFSGPARTFRRITRGGQAACRLGSSVMTSSSTALECGCCFSHLAAAS